ncbi:MAG: hypothetical protein M1826_001410 [Phylliscum demangeonii]|nr:MAG: hypothetical protein M1826_001410 [Phylliscum demangeonii]
MSTTRAIYPLRLRAAPANGAGGAFDPEACSAFIAGDPFFAAMMAGRSGTLPRRAESKFAGFFATLDRRTTTSSTAASMEAAKPAVPTNTRTTTPTSLSSAAAAAVVPALPTNTNRRTTTPTSLSTPAAAAAAVPVAVNVTRRQADNTHGVEGIDHGLGVLPPTPAPSPLDAVDNFATRVPATQRLVRRGVPVPAPSPHHGDAIPHFATRVPATQAVATRGASLSGPATRALDAVVGRPFDPVLEAFRPVALPPPLACIDNGTSPMRMGLVLDANTQNALELAKWERRQAAPRRRHGPSPPTRHPR